MKKDILKLVICLIVCQSAGLLGAIFTSQSVNTWYKTIQKPFFTPPSWLFAPVWIILYALMAISAFLIWRKGLDVTGVRRALFVFLIQLILNALWSPAFFGLRSPLAGMVVIVLLWAGILWTIIEFKNVSLFSAVILIPYYIWVSYASVLNAAILKLNGP